MQKVTLNGSEIEESRENSEKARFIDIHVTNIH